MNPYAYEKEFDNIVDNLTEIYERERQVKEEYQSEVEQVIRFTLRGCEVD